ncbi:MAG: CocE/NonD family hydrolase, partial [Myxococcales bacterium]|nr:CocE/NonD family hydrolase [Myxococcales bacterium]
EVVADKTGYPAEMLELSMGHDSDLGIDSIKRVEILSAMREREPTLPEVDAGEMAALSTLGQIVDYMGATANFEMARPEPSSSVSGLQPAARPEPMGRYALELTLAPALGLSQPGLQHAVWVVGDGDVSDVAHAIVDELLVHGVEGRAASVDDVPADARAVIYLGGLTADASPDSGRRVAREAFALAHRVAGSLKDGGLFVTVQDTGGDFGLSGSDRAWLGSLPGLTKTAHQEWPDASTKAIDIRIGDRTPEELAEALVDELIAGGPELEVALDAVRLTPVSVQRPASVGPLSLDADSVVVVSGGARGVTAACVVDLARATGAKFVLLGRTALEDEPAAVRGIADDAGMKRALMMAAKATGEAVTAGPSAMGITQYALGGRAHPGHVGVVAWIGTPDPYGHALFPGGSYREALVDGWLKATGSSGVLDALDPDPALWPVPETLPEGLHIGGWYDVFSQGPIDAFALGGGRLVMGPWTHETVGTARVGGRRFPDADALDLRAMRHAEVLARLDLAEGPDGPRVQYYLMGADEPDAPGNTWREAEDWPPSAVDVRMYLQADGSLAEACPTGGTTAYVSDPAEPVPTLCGRNLFLDAGPCDRAELAERDDVRAFVGPVLDAPREIVGRVTARLHVDLDATDADLVVHLVDVYPDGRHVQIAEGQARAAWRDGAIEPVQGVVSVDVDLWSTAVVLPAGHRVGIHVSSTDFPRLAIAPADAVPWAERHTVEPRPVGVRLHHDPSRPSWVQLPDPQRAAPGLRCETD